MHYDGIRHMAFIGAGASAPQGPEQEEVSYPALEHAEQLARRKELYLAKYPSTGNGKAPGKAGGGKKKRDAKTGTMPAFADDAAAKTGASQTSVRRSVQIATAIPADLREQLRGTAVEDKVTELLRLGQITLDE